MSKDVLKLALEALENSYDYVAEEADRVERMYGNYSTRQGKVKGLQQDERKHMEAITAIKQALEQPVQEPVQEPVAGCACRWDHEDNRISTCERHQGWLEVIAEWADRAREAEAKLKAAAHPTPVQEPVAWIPILTWRWNNEQGYWEGRAIDTPLYTTPPAAPVHSGLDADCIASVVSQRYPTPPAAPAQEFVCSTGLCHYKAQRPWVGLTDDERTEIRREHYARTLPLMEAIETKLKEKNT